VVELSALASLWPVRPLATQVWGFVQVTASRRWRASLTVEGGSSGALVGHSGLRSRWTTSKTDSVRVALSPEIIV
jgi:hypothetical protein